MNRKGTCQLLTVVDNFETMGRAILEDFIGIMRLGNILISTLWVGLDSETLLLGVLFYCIDILGRRNVFS